jgi:hypothetical protein
VERPYAEASGRDESSAKRTERTGKAVSRK